MGQNAVIVLLEHVC